MSTSYNVTVDSANTARIIYTPESSWILNYYYNTSAQGIYDGTLTSTSNAANVQFDFVGTRVLVFGSVGNESNPSTSPFSSYTVDGTPLDEFQGVLPPNQTQQDGVQFFDSGMLLNGSHTLTINVTWEVTSSNTYMLDYIVYSMLDPNAPAVVSSTSASGATSAGSTSVSPSPTSTELFKNSSMSVGAKAGSVIGGLAVLAALVIALCFCYRRKRATRDDADTLPSPMHFDDPFGPWNSTDNVPDGAKYRNGIPYGPGAEMAQDASFLIADRTSRTSLVAWPPSAELSLLTTTSRRSMPRPDSPLTPYAAPTPSSPSTSSLVRPLPTPTSIRFPAVASSTLLAPSALTSGTVMTTLTADDPFASDASLLPSPARIPPPSPELHRDSGIRFEPGVAWPAKAIEEGEAVEAPPVYTRA
ncbi:hypothetical protein BKA93DRAFT_827885 [Sparassis latifolia]